MKNFHMKKMKIIMIGVILIIAAGCSAEKPIPNTTAVPQSTAEAEQHTLIEDEYYKQNQKLDNSTLYVSPKQDYCIQLPENSDTEETGDSNSGKYTELMNTHIGAYGSISVGTEAAEYKALTYEEIQKLYENHESYTSEEQIAYNVSDFDVIYDSGNEEIGRKYVLKSSDGVAILKHEYKYGGQTMIILGFPKNDECLDVINSYMDSFRLLV